jgi:CBS domain-containing membrane protein
MTISPSSLRLHRLALDINKAKLRRNAGMLTGCALCVFAIELFNKFVWFGDSLPLLITPIGAAAALLFSNPHASSAAPWAVIGGAIASGLAGVLAYSLLPLLWACPAAVLLSLALMQIGRCFHPPGVAVALTAVLGDPEIHRLGFGFVLKPIAVDWLLLFLLFRLSRLAGGAIAATGELNPKA